MIASSYLIQQICKSCRPQKEYIRLFDVTERTAKGRHKTGRTCSKCNGKLQDTIVHFGEKGGLLSPYKWRLATKAASKADVIICLGSSLKVVFKVVLKCICHCLHVSYSEILHIFMFSHHAFKWSYYCSIIQFFRHKSQSPKEPT